MKKRFWVGGVIAVLVGAGIGAHALLSAGSGLPPIEFLSDFGLTPAFADQPYGRVSDSQKLDVYLPAQGKGPFPVAIFLHGGGFRYGDKGSSIPPIVKAVLGKGVAVATVNYRLSGEATFPAAPRDVARAIEYLRAQAGRLHLDGARLVVMGESAGANLASLAGVAATAPLMRAELVDPHADIRPLGVVALFPPVDFAQLDSLLARQGCTGQAHAQAGSFEARYLGGAFTTVPERVKAANPITYIDAQTPPFLIQNGSADCMVGTGQSQLLVAALKAAGRNVTYTLIPGAGHGGAPFETPQNAALIADWVARIASKPAA